MHSASDDVICDICLYELRKYTMAWWILMQVILDFVPLNITQKSFILFPWAL
jgi:hypothetical protein